jgi:hypothetical protein
MVQETEGKGTESDESAIEVSNREFVNYEFSGRAGTRCMICALVYRNENHRVARRRPRARFPALGCTPEDGLKSKQSNAHRLTHDENKWNIETSTDDDKWNLGILLLTDGDETSWS